jgi:DNA-binding response OmpR family regulator
MQTNQNGSLQKNNSSEASILLIEDDVYLGDVLFRKLQNDGFKVEISRDGALGLRRIKDLKPDLVLLDIILPTMNGYEILEAKFKDKEIAGIPVIIISNSGQPVEISRVLAFGVKDYLVKAQFDPEEVVTKIRQQLLSSKISSNDLSIISNKPIEKPADFVTVPMLTGKKIMWIEDDVFLNDIISRKLSNQGCTLFHAVDGEQALAQVETAMPDVILLDIVLSGIDGFEILRRLKANPKVKNIPVILLSNLGQKADMDKAKELGAASFMIKATVLLDEVIEEIKKVSS